MSETGYRVLAICIVVALLAIFVVSFLLFVKTPAPKGCEKSPSDQGYYSFRVQEDCAGSCKSGVCI